MKISFYSILNGGGSAFADLSLSPYGASGVPAGAEDLAGRTTAKALQGAEERNEEARQMAMRFQQGIIKG